MPHILKGGFGEGKEHLPHLDTFRDQEDKATEAALMMYNSSVVGTTNGPSWGFTTPHGFYMAPTINCPKNIHDKHPQFAKPVFACDHCVTQDPIHPVGIILMDRGFYVCKRCFGAMQSKRKWRYWEDLKVTCHHCIKDEVDRIIKIDPTLFTDYLNITMADLSAKPKLFS